MDTKPIGVSKKVLLASLSLLVLAVVIVGTVAADHSSKQAAMTSSTSTPTTPVVASNVSYKDGTYTAVGNYDSPGGTESIKISLTLASNDVTATSAVSMSNPNTPISSVYQQEFIGGYKSLVVGKPIAHLNVKNVAGSSLTSLGYNKAVDQIEQQAKA
jgi:uncharacterized protein with FMN-binding domain